jgi:hypothetical protein
MTGVPLATCTDKGCANCEIRVSFVVNWVLRKVCELLSQPELAYHAPEYGPSTSWTQGIPHLLQHLLTKNKQR